MNVHKALTILFGILAGLFVLGRFYDILHHSNLILSILIVAMSFHVVIILAIGLVLYNRKKLTGFWLLLIFQFFVLARHIYEYWTMKAYQPVVDIPGDVLSRITMPYLDLVFFSELIIGLAAIVLLFATSKHRKDS